MNRQLKLLQVPHSSFYYKSQQEISRAASDEQVKDEMLEIYMETPFYGVPRLTAELKRRGYKVNHKRVRRMLESADGLSASAFQYLGTTSGTCEIPVSSAQMQDRASESSMEHGHHLYGGSWPSGICNRNCRLVQSQGFGLQRGEYNGRFSLC